MCRRNWDKGQQIATLHLSDAITCPSNVTRDYIASLGLSRKRVTVITNGVSLADFQPLLCRRGKGEFRFCTLFLE